VVKSLHSSVVTFIATARDPILLDPGEHPFELKSGQYAIELAAGVLLLQAWDDNRNLTRHATRIGAESPGRLELHTRRLGKPDGRLFIIDRAKPNNTSLHKRSARLQLRERFRRQLARNFPGWRIASLTVGADLEHSLSPSYARAMIVRGASTLAVICAPPDPTIAANTLTAGIIWLDYLRTRETKRTIEGLALFVPEGSESVSCLRVRCLHPKAGAFSVFACSNEEEWEQQININVHGNLDLPLAPPPSINPNAHPLTPEARLEQRIRRQIRSIDALLEPRPVYGQVPAIAGVERGIIDLLTVDLNGRLAVVELKASADLNLPLQALDYWMRVDWQQKLNAFTKRGYFPGIALAPTSPRLLLVAPALEFHPTTEIILRYFAPNIGVERIGVNIDWERSLVVMFRIKGAQSPV
jgi:hypothetical protein